MSSKSEQILVHLETLLGAVPGVTGRVYRDRMEALQRVELPALILLPEADKGLALMLGVGLGQAAQGDERTLLRAWQLANSAGLVQPGLIAQVQALATTFNLPAAFVGGLQSPGLPPIQPGGVQNLGGLGTTVLITNPLPPEG